MRCLPLLACLSLVAACGGDDAPPDDNLLAPPPDGEGVQFTMSTTVAAGVEGEWCRFVTAPAAAMRVQRDEVRFTEGSHHFLLYETAYATIPTQTNDGRAVDTSGVFDCSSGPTDGWSITKLVGGSQNGSGDSMLAFPDGVAMPVRGGAVLLMNAHYLNATDHPLAPEIRINLWTAADAAVDGDILFLYNPAIRVPASGTARARWRCPVHADIQLGNVQSHMHRRGVGYAAGVAGQTPFYDNNRWEVVPVRTFEPPLAVAAGAALDYYCDYANGEDRTVYQGARSTDEMCMLIGSYWPANPRTSNCLDAEGGIGGEWVGNGTATCAATFDCLQAAFGVDGDPLHAITDCMLDASPDVAAPSSALLRCFMNEADPGASCGSQIAACRSS